MQSAATLAKTTTDLCNQLYRADWPSGPTCDRPLDHDKQGKQTHRWRYLVWTDSPKCSLDQAKSFVLVLRKIPFDSARQVALNDDGSVTVSFGAFYLLADRPTP